MKKLIAVLAAVAGALGLHAANNIGTSFEGLLLEGVASTNYVDVFSVGGAEIETGKTPGDYWDVSAAVFDEEGFVVKNYGEETKPTDDQRSDYYSTYANTNYLAITTKVGNPVTRYINAEDAGSHAAVTVLNDGSYYFDASVKFTAFETNKEASVILADGGKLAIWLRANVDPDTLEPTSTDLIVSAGRLSDNEGWVTTATNYVCELRNPGGVDVTDGGWHRVSVKMFGSIYDDDIVPGFSIAIDSKLVTFVGEKGDTGITDNGHLTARVKKLRNLQALFPSAVLTHNTTAISSVSFDGVGALDDLVFTDTNPSIADWNESGSVTIDAGDNVTGYTYTIQGESPVVASGTVNLQYSAVEGKTITISGVVCENGYVPSGVSTNGTDILEGWEISDIFDMETITVLAKDAGATVSGAAGDANKGYATVAEVFAAIHYGTITPATPGGTITVTLNKGADESITLDASSVSVVLDLAGQTITAPSAEENAAIYLVNGSLTIIDSVGGGTVDGSEMAYPQAVATDVGTSSLVISNGTFIGATYAGDADPWEISGGRFDVANNPIADLNEATLPDGYELAEGTGDDTGYYILQEIPPVTPIPTDTGSATYDDEATADAAADAINNDKTTYIEVPAEANVVDRATYNTYVEAVADGVKVTIEFTALGEEVATNRAETAVMMLPVADVANASGTANATIVNSQPGLYYSIMTNSQPTAFSSECEYGVRTVGNGSSITLPVPNLGDRGFYKVKVSPRKVQ